MLLFGPLLYVDLTADAMASRAGLEIHIEEHAVAGPDSVIFHVAAALPGGRKIESDYIGRKSIHGLAVTVTVPGVFDYRDIWVTDEARALEIHLTKRR